MHTDTYTPAVDDVEEDDVSALDRGDNLDDAADIDEADISRDAKGRFAAPDKAETADKTEEEAEAEPEAEAESEDEDDKVSDVKSLEVARRKALQQRDAERARAIELEARLKAMEERAERAEPPKERADPAVAMNAQLDTLYEQVEEARADADTKKAAQLQREIDKINREISKLETSHVAAQTVTQAQIDARYDAMIDVLESRYPELDPESDDYDRNVVREMNELVNAYEKAGRNAPDALRKAANLIFREDPFGKQPKAAKAEPEVKQPETKKPEAKKTDVRKAVDTAKRQPPDVSDRGVNRDTAVIDVERLSEDEMDKLPESKKRELRGDFLGV